MKKDIEIPEVKEVYLAAVKEFNEEFNAEEWNVYIINNKSEALETVLILTRGFDGARKTSSMRHRLEKLPPKSYARIEFVQDEVLGLNNEYLVTFFTEGKMYDKKYLFSKNSINTAAQTNLPVMQKKGVLVK